MQALGAKDRTRKHMIKVYLPLAGKISKGAVVFIIRAALRKLMADAEHRPSRLLGVFFIAHRVLAVVGSVGIHAFYPLVVGAGAKIHGAVCIRKHKLAFEQRWVKPVINRQVKQPTPRIGHDPFINFGILLSKGAELYERVERRRGSHSVYQLIHIDKGEGQRRSFIDPAAQFSPPREISPQLTRRHIGICRVICAEIAPEIVIVLKIRHESCLEQEILGLVRKEERAAAYFTHRGVFFRRVILHF